MAEPFTYHDDGGDDLEPAEREVACRYYLDAGPQHTEFVTQFLGHLLREEPIILIDGGRQRRSFTYVEDGIEALLRILQNEGGRADGRIFNIGNPENDRSIRELADAMVRILGEFPGCEGKARNARIVEQSATTYYGDEYQDVMHRVPSIRHARVLLDWRPKHGFDEAIRRTIAYYVQTESLPGDGSIAAEMHG